VLEMPAQQACLRGGIEACSFGALESLQA